MSSSACATLYSGAHWMTIGVSRLRSPLHIALPYGNAPLSPTDYVNIRSPVGDAMGAESLWEELNLDERLAASDSKELTLRFVALSGGGSRAAAFSAFVLRDTESLYNAAPVREDLSFYEMLDGFSTVSGGSIYAGYVATAFALNESGRDYLFSTVETARELRGLGGGDTRYAFRILADDYFDYYTYLGGRAGCAYCSPANACIGPAYSLFTNADILDLYSQTLNTDYAINAYTRFQFKHLESRPKFIFNATNHSDFRPFLFTRGRFHRGPATSFDPAAVEDGSIRTFENPLIRWHKNEASEFEPGRPFPYALTLEDLNSDSDEFTIAYAVMASAAFPGVTEPLPLWYYRPERDGNRLRFEKAAVVRVADGGLYENYGLTAALESYDYIRRQAAERGATVRLKILSVDSANRARPPEEEESCVGLQSNFGVGSPVRGAVPAVESMSRSYDAGQAVIRSILAKRAAADSEGSGQIEVAEINLADCSYFDDVNSEAVQTNYIITQQEAGTLEECSEELVLKLRRSRSFVE
ncbi:MAG: patatin-like phospholipase family protein [bacterium]|nr:patatin-like phospholipase family protein [bacterium]